MKSQVRHLWLESPPPPPIITKSQVYVYVHIREFTCRFWVTTITTFKILAENDTLSALAVTVIYHSVCTLGGKKITFRIREGQFI